jgi:hypothetical protein
MLSVAIALEPTAEVAAVAQVTRSCEEAIGDGRCPAASELAPASVVTWYALVHMEGPSAPTLEIEFHDRSAAGSLIEKRVLSFSERDSAESRWASAGAVIAAFVAARDGTVGPPMPRPRPLPAPLAPPPPAPLPLRWNADLALFTGPALDRGAFRWGGLARGYLAAPQAPRVLGLVSLRYAEADRKDTVDLSWWAASAGIGARLGGHDTPLSAELTGELSFERLSMAATDLVTAEREATSQNRFGGRLSVNFSLQVAGPLGVVVGAEANALRPSVAIRVGEEDLGRAPAVSYACSAGLRVFGGP